MKILLVAGHGGGDPGACARGYKEAELAREVVADLKKALEKFCDVSVFDTTKNLYRYQKQKGNLDFRCYDYVFEVHFNAGGGKGTEVLISEGGAVKRVDGAMLKFIGELGFYDRGVKRRSDLYNMNICKKQLVPYSLLELCFIDSAEDMERFLKNKRGVIDALAKGLKEGLGIVAKELTEVNDIVWELSERRIITDKELWLAKLREDKNAYWLARKCVNYIINI